VDIFDLLGRSDMKRGDGEREVVLDGALERSEVSRLTRSSDRVQALARFPALSIKRYRSNSSMRCSKSVLPAWWARCEMCRAMRMSANDTSSSGTSRVSRCSASLLPSGSRRIVAHGASSAQRCNYSLGHTDGGERKRSKRPKTDRSVPNADRDELTGFTAISQDRGQAGRRTAQRRVRGRKPGFWGRRRIGSGCCPLT
jgi:hypothetical protein